MIARLSESFQRFMIYYKRLLLNGQSVSARASAELLIGFIDDLMKTEDK